MLRYSLVYLTNLLVFSCCFVDYCSRFLLSCCYFSLDFDFGQWLFCVILLVSLYLMVRCFVRLVTMILFGQFSFVILLCFQFVVVCFGFFIVGLCFEYSFTGWFDFMIGFYLGFCVYSSFPGLDVFDVMVGLVGDCVLLGFGFVFCCFVLLFIWFYVLALF